MRLKEMIDDDEYTSQKKQLKSEILRIKASIKDKESNAENWLTLTAQTFEFAHYAHKAFMNGNAETKREILSGITNLNCTLKDNILHVQTVDWLIPIEEAYPEIESQYMALEPEKRFTQKGQKEAFTSLSPYVRDLVDSVGTAIRKHNAYIFIADVKNKV
jgi:hypothetical protein